MKKKAYQSPQAAVVHLISVGIMMASARMKMGTMDYTDYDTTEPEISTDFLID
jgi:hypothetical protein